MSTLEAIGALLLLYLLVYRPLHFIANLVLNNCTLVGHSSSAAAKVILTPSSCSPPEWAVITGATDGCGLEYAKQLAEKGYHLLLISRSRGRLERVREEITSMCPACRVELLTVDFSEVTFKAGSGDKHSTYSKIKAKLATLDGRLYILVNNVGVAYPSPEYFTALPEGFHIRLINTNLISTVVMTELVIQRMLIQDSSSSNSNSQTVNSCVDPEDLDRFEPSPERPLRGLIINLSSVLSLTECPLNATSGATKAALNYLSRALSAEYSYRHGIFIQTVLANQVNTKAVAKGAIARNWFGVSAFDFVWYSLKAVARQEAVTSAHPLHKLLNGVIVFARNHLPESVFMALKMKIARRIRAKYQEDRERGGAMSEVALMEQD